MKKIISFSLLFLLIVNKAFPAWAINGETNTCATLGVTKSYVYQLTGFPSGSTEHSFSVGTTGGTITQGADDKFTVIWNSDCSGASTKIQTIGLVTWAETTNGVKSYKTYSSVIELTVNVARLGPLATNAWNVGPYACSTSPITYSIPAVCGASNYSWVIPSGWSPTTTLSGANVTSITVVPTANTGGTISVNVINSTNGCSLSRTISANIVRPVQPPVFSTTQIAYCGVASGQISVNAVPNATSYSWTYPSGWTGPAVTTNPYTTVNFNGVEQTGKIACKTNASCGGTSAPTEFSITYAGALPTDAGISYTVAITGSVSLTKKIVTVTVSSCYWKIVHSTMGSNGYLQAVYSNDNYSGNSPTGTTTNLTMKNGDRVTVSVHNRNACGRSVGTGIGYDMVNGNLQQAEVQRPVLVSSSDVNKATDNFRIFPNPASDNVTLNFESSETVYTIAIYDLVGKKVKETFEVSGNKAEVNISDLKNGIYFLQIEDGKTIIKKEKIVVNH